MTAGQILLYAGIALAGGSVAAGALCAVILRSKGRKLAKKLEDEYGPAER